MYSLELSLAVLRITHYILIYLASEREGGRGEGEKREAIINSLSLSVSHVQVRLFFGGDK